MKKIQTNSELNYVQIMAKADISNGERVFVEVDGLEIVVFNIADEIFAIGDICTHDDGPLGDGETNGYEIACPRHGARFDIKSGKALTLPAIEDIPAYPVQIRDDFIKIGLPKGE